MQDHLTVSDPSDRHETEAARAAVDLERGTPLRGYAGAPAAHPGTGGMPLPSALRRRYEPLLGIPLDTVRVHSDGAAAAFAEGLSARAVTIGEDVRFAAGAYAPDTTAGRQLVAHELVHVAQQRARAVGPTAQRAETDSNAPGVRKGLKDGAPALNTEVNKRIVAARTATKGKTLAVFLVAAYKELGDDNGSGFLAQIEAWANKSLPSAGGGTGPTAATGTKYEDVPLKLRASLYLYLAPVVRLGSVFCGTDKIGHFFQQGFQYLTLSDKALGEGRGDDYAVAWGEWMEGVLSPAHAKDPALVKSLTDRSTAKENTVHTTGYERGHFGLGMTGVHSNADLEANRQGLKFWQDLKADPAGYKFDIAKYVTASWDEEVAGNVYSSSVGAAVKSAGRFNKADRIEPSPGFPTP